MNNSPLPRSRPLCSLVRRWEAGFGPASGHGRLAACHLETCAECREFFAEDPDFERTLRRDAVSLRGAPAEPGLERRILQAVRQAELREDISPVWSRALLVSAGLAAALAFVFWPRRPETLPETPVVAVKEAAPRLSSPSVAAEARGWWRALEARGPGFAWAEKNPLEREIESVRTDARAVIGFLALNFLPSKPKPEEPPSQG